MTDNVDESLSFPRLGYSDDQLNTVWQWIRDDLATQGRVFNQKIAENHDACPADYPRDTLVKDVLPKLRDSLEEKDIIEIAHEKGGGEGKAGADRKLWIIDEGDTAE